MRHLGEENTDRYKKALDPAASIDVSYILKAQDASVKVIMPDLRYNRNSNTKKMMSDEQWSWLET